MVIPVWNAASTIAEAVRSAASQKYPPEEIIVVDDGSTDGTSAVVNKLTGDYRNVRYIRQENAGPSSARNRGIREAKGEYIAFCDADDHWLPHKLQVQMQYLSVHPECGMIGARTDGSGSEGRIIPVTFGSLLLKNRFVTSTVVIRRDIASAFGFNHSQKYSEDYRLWLQVVYHHPAALCDETLAVYGDGKPGFGCSGLSSKLWPMEKGELSNFRYLYNEGYLKWGRIGSFLIWIFVSAWSLMKFMRRLIFVFVRRLIAGVKR